MLRKIKKLRGFLYITLGVLLFVFLFNQNEFSKARLAHLSETLGNLKNNEQFFDDLHEPNQDIFINFVVKNKSIITLDTYVSPPPCLNCPGENGSAVTILVSSKSF